MIMNNFITILVIIFNVAIVIFFMYPVVVQFSESRKSGEKLVFCPLLPTLYFFLKGFSVNAFTLIANLLFYAYGIFSFAYTEWNNLNAAADICVWIFIIFKIILLVWIYDFAMFLIIWLVSVVMDAAYERKIQPNKNLGNYFHIIQTIICFPILDIGVSKSNANLWVILSSWFIMISIFISQSYYIKDIFRRLIKGAEFVNKKAAVQECILLYVSLILSLSELLYLSAYTWENFFSGKANVTIFKCLWYCIMNFTGLGSVELEPGINMAFAITGCIRIIGLLAIGFLAAEILASNSLSNRSEQEAYWKTMYDLKSVLCVVGEIRAYLVDKSQIEKIYPNSKEECRLSTEFANIIDKLPEKIDDINYWVKSRRAMDEQLQGLRSLFLDLDDQKAKARSMQIHEIKDTIKNVQNELMELEKKLTQVWEERSF